MADFTHSASSWWARLYNFTGFERSVLPKSHPSKCSSQRTPYSIAPNETECPPTQQPGTWSHVPYGRTRAIASKRDSFIAGLVGWALSPLRISLNQLWIYRKGASSSPSFLRWGDFLLALFPRLARFFVSQANVYRTDMGTAEFCLEWSYKLSLRNPAWIDFSHAGFVRRGMDAPRARVNPRSSLRFCGTGWGNSLA